MHFVFVKYYFINLVVLLMWTLYFYHLICFVLLPPQTSCIFATSYTLCCCQIMHFVFLLHHALFVLKDVFCPDITPGWLSMKKQVSSLYFYCIMHFVVLTHHILCVFTTSCTTTCILYNIIHHVFVPHHVLCTTSCIVYFYHIMHCVFYLILHTVFLPHHALCILPQHALCIFTTARTVYFYHTMHCVFLPHHALCIFTTLHTVYVYHISHCIVTNHALCISSTSHTVYFQMVELSLLVLPQPGRPPLPQGPELRLLCPGHRLLSPQVSVSLISCQRGVCGNLPPTPHPPLHPNCPWGQNSHCYIQTSCCGSIGQYFIYCWRGPPHPPFHLSTRS